jgi:hypothetical protein
MHDYHIIQQHSYLSKSQHGHEIGNVFFGEGLIGVKPIASLLLAPGCGQQGDTPKNVAIRPSNDLFALFLFQLLSQDCHRRSLNKKSEETQSMRKRTFFQ